MDNSYWQEKSCDIKWDRHTTKTFQEHISMDAKMDIELLEEDIQGDKEFILMCQILRSLKDGFPTLRTPGVGFTSATEL